MPLAAGDGFDLLATTDRLGMAVVHDADAGLWAIGPESFGGRALVSAEAPELALDDIDGNPFTLSSLRGQKVVHRRPGRPIEAVRSICQVGRHSALNCIRWASRS